MFKRKRQMSCIQVGKQRLQGEYVSFASFQVLPTSGETPNDVCITLLNQSVFDESTNGIHFLNRR